MVASISSAVERGGLPRVTGRATAPGGTAAGSSVNGGASTISASRYGCAR